MSDEKKFSALDTAQANEMFEKQASIIQSHNVKSILDIGCRLARPLEWLDHGTMYHGFDIDYDYIIELEKKFPKEEYPNVEWQHGDWDNPPFEGHYDCLIFGGMFYYNKDEVVKLMEHYISLYSPKLIIICDIDYKSPAHWWAADFSELKEKYFHKEYSITLLPGFYGMEKRVIFEIDLTKQASISNGSLRENSPPPNKTYTGLISESFPVEEMMEWIYVTNTEPLDNIGKVMSKDLVLDYWVGVAAGFKPYYTLCKFGVTKDTRIIYADVSPREIDWRKYFDKNYRFDMDDNDLTELYIKYQEQNPSCEFIRGNIYSIGESLRKEREFLNITDDDWRDMWHMYNDLEKVYNVTNIIDDVDSVLELIRPGTPERPTNGYVWTSNAWDWHQFRYTEEDYFQWRKKVREYLNSDFFYDGKIPPFSSML